MQVLPLQGSRTSADERAWLRRLRRLDLTNNKLLRVPPELEQCTSLEHLSLDNNYDVLGSDMEVLQVGQGGQALPAQCRRLVSAAA